MKYLLEIHHGIGDVAQFTGLLDSISAYDKDAEIGVILNKRAYGAFFERDERVRHTYVIDLRGTKRDLLKNVLAIRAGHYDYMFCSPISNARDETVFVLLCGAKRAYGEQLRLLSRFSQRYGWRPAEFPHIVQRNFAVLASSGLPVSPCYPRLICPDSTPAEISPRSVGLCVGASKPQKTWAIEHYIEVGRHFETLGYQIVLLGGAAEAERYAPDFFPASWTNLLGKTSLLETASVCRKCALVIGCDTGVMHIAAAVNVKTVCVFSYTNPQMHAPFSDKSYVYCLSMPCQYCYDNRTAANCTDYACIKNVEAKDIISLSEAALRGSEDAEPFRFKASLDASPR